MYTRCPNCQTYFKISADQLTKASGKVRCGQCKKVFNSLGNLLEELPVALADRGKTKPAPTPPAKAAAPRIPSIPVSTPAASTPKPRISSVTAAMARSLPQKPAATVPAPPIVPPSLKPAPRATRAAETRPTPKRKVIDDNIVLYNDEEKPKASKASSRDAYDLTSADKIENVQAGPHSTVRDLVIYPGPSKNYDDARAEAEFERPDLTNAFWGAGVAFLFILFIFQYTYYMRDDLARYAELRPLVQKLCAITQCELPLQQSLEQIKLTQRDIISHPRVKGALLINAVIVSNATFAQPFPIMQISLSNINGKVIAKRRFQPTEYLDADVNIRRGMAPGNSVQIVLEIADPGKDAVNFEFTFF